MVRLQDVEKDVVLLLQVFIEFTDISSVYQVIYCAVESLREELAMGELLQRDDLLQNRHVPGIEDRGTLLRLLLDERKALIGN